MPYKSRWNLEFKLRNHSDCLSRCLLKIKYNFSHLQAPLPRFTHTEVIQMSNMKLMQSLLLLLYHRYHLSELQDWGLTPIALGMGYLCVLVLSHSLEQSKYKQRPKQEKATGSHSLNLLTTLENFKSLVNSRYDWSGIGKMQSLTFDMIS